MTLCLTVKARQSDRDKERVFLINQGILLQGRRTFAVWWQQSGSAERDARPLRRAELGRGRVHLPSGERERSGRDHRLCCSSRSFTAALLKYLM